VNNLELSPPPIGLQIADVSSRDIALYSKPYTVDVWGCSSTSLVRLHGVVLS
jgi:hypothetical protein